MTKDNEDALRCADSLQRCDCIDFDGDFTASAAHLRRLVAENEAKDALLRQAVEALEEWVCDFWSRHDDDATKLITAIRQHLEGKA